MDILKLVIPDKLGYLVLVVFSISLDDSHKNCFRNPYLSIIENENNRR